MVRWDSSQEAAAAMMSSTHTRGWGGVAASVERGGKENGGKKEIISPYSIECCQVLQYHTATDCLSLLAVIFPFPPPFSVYCSLPLFFSCC